MVPEIDSLREKLAKVVFENGKNEPKPLTGIGKDQGGRLGGPRHEESGVH